MLIPALYKFSAPLLRRGDDLGGGGPGSSSLLGCTTLACVKGKSTIVVFSQVARINSTYPVRVSNGGIGFINTVFELNVATYVKGAGPPTIFVVDSAVYAVPPIAIGASYVLFLSNAWLPCPPADSGLCSYPSTPLSMTYGILGGAMGRFAVLNGLVYSYKALYPKDYSYLPVDVNGVSLDQFLSQVSNL